MLITRLLPVAGAFVLTGAFAQTPAEDEFTFRFQPPDGVRMDLDYVLQRARTTPSGTVRDEAESRTSGVFKRTANGFEYAPKTLSASLRRNGSPVNDPVLTVLSKLQPRYTLSADGEALAIAGFENVSTLLTSSVPPPVAAAMASLVNEEVLVGQQRAEWNARYADYTGGKFTIGDVIDAEVPQPLPNGETITYTVRTSFPRWEPCPAGRCVRLEQVFESDAEALTKMATGVANRVIAAASAAAPPLSSGPKSRVTGSLSRLIDPNTMLIYAERLERTITMQIVSSPGKKPEEVRMDETRVYSYTYH